MNDHFSCLFVVPQNQTKQDYFTPSKYFPMDAHFEHGHESALTYLRNCTSEDFPSLIVLEEAFGFKQNLRFIEEYRSYFYLVFMDTLLFTCNRHSKHQTSQYPAIVSDSLTVPFSKQVFMKKVFPLLTVYMV